MRARLRSGALSWALVGLAACRPASVEPPDVDPTSSSSSSPVGEREPLGNHDDDPRVDPTRCSGDRLDLVALVSEGLCAIPSTEALALAGPEQLELIAPKRLVVEAGGRIEFELELHNRGTEPLDVDLRFGPFLPLAPEATARLDGASGPDSSCTLRAISTDPPPERLTLPPDAELSVPCEWYANTRLVDPSSYVGSECPDFPVLPPGRYRSVFRVYGGAGSDRAVEVEIEVRAASG